MEQNGDALEELNPEELNPEELNPEEHNLEELNPEEINPEELNPIAEIPINLPATVKPKKRSRNPERWKNNVIKRAKIAGLEHRRYLSARIVPARELRTEECRHDCHEKITAEEKQHVFQKFNLISSHDAQNIYLQSCTVPLQNGRHDYILQLSNRIEVVCQKIFLATHGIKRSRLHKKVLNRGVNIEDQRGRHDNHHKISEESMVAVRNFIENLDARESHYSRNSNKNKKFLNSKETITSLYQTFLLKHPNLNPQHEGESIRLGKFSYTLNYEYNIGFGYPRSDICETCEQLNTKIRAAVVNGLEEEEFNLSLEQQEHWINADLFIQKMSKNVLQQMDETHIFLCFDFQKNLPFPVTNVGKEFFLRQLWLFNFGIRNIRSGQTHLFSYAEHYARKGSSEVISFIKYYIENVVPNRVRHLHLFCDNSSGQNKNRFMMAYLLSLCPSRFETIKLELPLPGHSRMTIDGDFAHIEKKKKKEDRIEYPSEWIQLMRDSRNQNPFNIVFVNHPVTNNLRNDDTPITNVYDYKTSLTPLLIGALGRISKIKGLLYDRSGVYSRSTMDGNCEQRFNILKRNVRIEQLQHTIVNTPLAYHDYLPISRAKYNNLQTLLSYFFRPNESTFYDTINTGHIEEIEG